jgi:hypothetical protein
MKLSPHQEQIIAETSDLCVKTILAYTKNHGAKAQMDIPAVEALLFVDLMAYTSHLTKEQLQDFVCKYLVELNIDCILNSKHKQNLGLTND